MTTTPQKPDSELRAAFDEIAPPPPELVRQLFRMADLVTPMALRVAATLRLVDLVLAGTATAAGLAAATGANPQALNQLLRHLVAVGVLSTTEDGELRPTELGLLLTEGHPANQQAFLDLDLAIGRADMATVHLLSAVRTGRAVHELAHGRTFWEDLSADPALSASFYGLLFGHRDESFEAVAAAYDWSSVRHVVDVGGGAGGQVIALLRAAPRLRATLVDLAGPVERAREKLVEAGLADRCELVIGDFFEELPVRGDAIVLQLVLHDWPDEDAVRIMARCRAALEPGGRIVLVEKAVDPAAADPGFTSMDLRMLVYVGGRERTVADWSALAARAGLRIDSVSPPFGFGTSVLCLSAVEDAPGLDNGRDLGQNFVHV